VPPELAVSVVAAAHPSNMRLRVRHELIAARAADELTFLRWAIRVDPTVAFTPEITAPSAKAHFDPLAGCQIDGNPSTKDEFEVSINQCPRRRGEQVSTRRP